MKRLYHEVKQIGEVFDIGQLSSQLKDFLTLISEGKEIDSKKFTQISPEALSFLQEKAQFLEENELRYILLGLLTEPKPENQRNIIEIFEKILGENKEKISEKINQNRIETQKSIYFYETLERARERDWHDCLLYFYSNPKNQKIRPDILNKTLERVKERGWYDLLFNFYSNPKNQEIKPDILNEALEKARKEGWWNGLLSLYSNPENQYITDELLNEILNGALEKARREKWWHDLLSFYSNPENRKTEHDIKILNEALEGARNEGWWRDLIYFYSHPENQEIKPELLNEALNKALELAKRGNLWHDLIYFYSNPKNQYRRDELLNEALEGARKVGLWGPLLSFYSNPENQPKLTQTTQDKIIKSIKTIADENLHADVLKIYSKYFEENNPLSLFLLSKNEDLPTLISAYNLNIKPEVILSWNLTQEEKETILPILMDLDKHNIKFTFPFIFYRRKEIKQTRKHNELIIDYLRTLDFIANLPQEIKDNLIENHFKNIENLVQKYNITQTTTDIPFSFLREIITDVKKFKKEAFQRLKQTLQIQEEITEKEWERFIKESKYLDQLITLAIHYSQKYRDGLPLLGKITTAIIKGTYFDLKYNLEDPINQEQLAPLLEDEQKKQMILDIWRGNYFSFHLQSVEEIKQETERVIDYTHILEHLRSQIIGDKHYEGILNLIPGLDGKDKGDLSTVFEKALTGKTINFGEIRQILEKYQLSKEKITCLIGIIQFLKDLNFNKNPEGYLSTLERLKESIKKHWPELLNTEIVQIDIFTYLQGQLNQLKSPSEKITRKRILVSYFTDHPKTLLEIGAYPVATCQNYRSKGSLNSKLLGYIFDAHIKALVAREIEIEEDIKIEDLEQAKIGIDDNNERITIILKDGRKIEASVSKPVARRIVMLGKLNDQSALLLEPIYSKGGRTSEEIEYLNKPINKLLKALINKGINIKTTISRATITPKSHNPAGYYRDL